MNTRYSLSSDDVWGNIDDEITRLNNKVNQN